MRRINWTAAIWAGLIAAIVFMMLEMAMGKEVLPPPATFELVPVIVAMMIHAALSIILAGILGWIISAWRIGLGASIFAGSLFGLLIYVVNFYGFTAIWPWFAMARNWISIFAHVMFGLVAGWAYYNFAVRGNPVTV